MKGPYPMGTGAESLFHVDSGDVRLKTQPVKYTSNDGSVSHKTAYIVDDLHRILQGYHFCHNTLLDLMDDHRIGLHHLEGYHY